MVTFSRPNYNFESFTNVYLTNETIRMRIIIEAENDFRNNICQTNLSANQLYNVVIIKRKDNSWERFFYNVCFSELCRHHKINYMKSTILIPKEDEKNNKKGNKKVKNKFFWCSSLFIQMKKNSKKYHIFHIQIKEETNTAFRWKRLNFRLTSHFDINLLNERIVGRYHSKNWNFNTVQIFLNRCKTQID